MEGYAIEIGDSLVDVYRSSSKQRMALAPSRQDRGAHHTRRISQSKLTGAGRSGSPAEASWTVVIRTMLALEPGHSMLRAMWLAVPGLVARSVGWWGW